MYQQPLSKYIAIIAFLSWFASLWFVALVSYTGDVIYGYEIVIAGWFGIFIGEIEWYVNPLLLIILVSLFNIDSKKFNTKKINTLMLLAILFSLQTIIFNDFYRLSGGIEGSSGEIFGYGLGFILWVSSIFITLIAVCQKNEELTDNSKIKVIAKKTKYIGTLLLAFTLGITAFLHYQDNKYANISDKEKLKVALFKRTKVCTCEPKIESTKTTGILEVIQPTTDYDIEGRKIIYMFNSPLKLLEWGVPIVRMNGMDYSLDKRSNEILLIARKAVDYAKFQLIISKDNQDIRTIIKSIAFENNAKKEKNLVDQVWKKESISKNDNEIFCPEFLINPSEEQYPRKMILQALNIKKNTDRNELSAIGSNHVEAKFYRDISKDINETELTESSLQGHPIYANCPKNIYIEPITSSVANLIGSRPMLQTLCSIR
ncbi:hypothetical protein [Sulfuricurvum sp.]|uniref:hypothetical protein n=1 Tax=Sulfuricurvum sp. TaxID=2025608 RepID=UPI002D598DC9|nr:hypothetical protein [Sulfuricurvum sp.]HZF70248.1 hypothetical protein [Sulfuricurvum sp.]